MRRVISF